MRCHDAEADIQRQNSGRTAGESRGARTYDLEGITSNTVCCCEKSTLRSCCTFQL